MRSIIARVFVSVGLITMVLLVALLGVIIREWPHAPAAPVGETESPPWGSLDAAIEEAQSRGKELPPFVADATHGPAADGALRVLVISAGGQYGAFGAGVLSGLTTQRPLARFRRGNWHIGWQHTCPDRLSGVGVR